MGGCISYPRSHEELLNLYSSPKRVRQLLLKSLYPSGIPKSIEQRSEAVEGDKQSARELENILGTAFPRNVDSGALSRVAPVLYRIMLHHAAYPFKPSQKPGRDVCLNAQGTAMARALLTTGDSSLITFQRRRERHASAIEGYLRGWEERCRLLFQSMSDTDWDLYQQNHRPQRSGQTARGYSEPDEKDNRDLVAVLAALENNDKWDRSVLKPVAAALPSSWSLMEDGSVAVEDLLALTEILDIYLEEKRDCGKLEHPVWHSCLDDSIRSPKALEELEKRLANEKGVPNMNAYKPSREALQELRNQLSIETRTINWNTFNSVLTEYMPYFIRDLALLIMYLFPSERHNCSAREHELLLPKPVADTYFRKVDGRLFAV